MTLATEITKEELTMLVENAQHITVITGAGISAESGVKTYRDAPDSHWRNHKPEELSSLDGFMKNPSLVWKFHNANRQSMLDALPNAAHLYLAKLEKRKSMNLFTQNIDDLHERAGSTVYHFHGSIHGVRCMNGCGWSGEHEQLTFDEEPKCPDCAALVRPNVIWFGEYLDGEILLKAVASIQDSDLIMIIGTSGVVEPVASLVFDHRNENSKVVSINPNNDDHMWWVDYKINSPAGKLFGQGEGAHPV